MKQPTINHKALMFRHNNFCLNDVLTIQELQLMYDMRYSSVHYYVETRKLDSRLTANGGVFLVARASAVKLFGQPKIDPVLQQWVGTPDDELSLFAEGTDVLKAGQSE